MSQAACTDIARSNIQKLFIVLEDYPGQIAYPTKEHFIAVANDATASQSPAYVDSPEKLGTRDILERFKEAMPAATATAAMVLRLGTLGEKPQGHDALVSLFGTSTVDQPPVFTLGASFAADTTIPLASMDATAPLPPCGVISVNGESIFYGGISEDGTELLNCKRGFNGTTADAIADGTAGSYESIAYMQTNCNPAFTVWLQTDHFLQAITGATINEASVSLSNSGAVTFEFGSIQGMEMVLAGTTKVTALAPSGSTVVTVAEPKMYTEKAWVWNPTISDNGGGADVGYARH